MKRTLIIFLAALCLAVTLAAQDPPGQGAGNITSGTITKQQTASGSFWKFSGPIGFRFVTQDGEIVFTDDEIIAVLELAARFVPDPEAPMFMTDDLMFHSQSELLRQRADELDRKAEAGRKIADLLARLKTWKADAQHNLVGGVQ